VKVSAQEIEQRQMVLEIEVEDERVERALDQAYKRIVNKINVPGFRKGRAPRPLVERMVGRQAMLEDAVEHLVPQAYEDALKEQQITPSGQPALEVTSTEPLQFKATVPLEPKVQLGDYRSIDIPADPVVVEDSEIDAVVQNLRESHAIWSPIERAVQVADRVGLDVVATRGERTIADSRDAEFVVNPDGPEPFPGFSQQLVGTEVGQERRFSLGGGETAEGGGEEPSQPAEFTVTVQWVKEKELPELDDEFARTVGERETVEALRDEIRSQIARRKQEAADERRRAAIIQAAVDQTQMEIPPQAVEVRAQELLDTMASTLDKQGISIQQYLQFTGKEESAFRAELMADAEQSLKRSLVLEAIATAEGLEVDESEVRREIELAAQGGSDPARTVRQAMDRPATRARISSVLRSRKGMQRILELSGAAPEEPTAAAENPAEAEAAEDVSESSGETNA
jgi:trigger factor